MRLRSSRVVLGGLTVTALVAVVLTLVAAAHLWWAISLGVLASATSVATAIALTASVKGSRTVDAVMVHHPRRYKHCLRGPVTNGEEVPQ